MTDRQMLVVISLFAGTWVCCGKTRGVQLWGCVVWLVCVFLMMVP
jgi:hypothetical protein